MAHILQDIQDLAYYKDFSLTDGTIIRFGTIKKYSYGFWAEGTIEVRNPNTITGKVSVYTFQAKFFQEPSCFGINEGCVSKLWISDEKHTKRIAYDRGWDVHCSEIEESTVMQDLLALLN